MRYRAGLMQLVTDLASARAHVGTRTNQGPRIDNTIEKLDRQHQLGMCIAPILGFYLTLIEASLFGLTGWFQIHLWLVI